jgi:hypothetical protein
MSDEILKLFDVHQERLETLLNFHKGTCDNPL